MNKKTTNETAKTESKSAEIAKQASQLANATQTIKKQASQLQKMQKQSHEVIKADILAQQKQYATISYLSRDKSKAEAEWVYERLAKQINEFEEKLDKDQEIGARLVSSPIGVFHIIDMQYRGSDLLIFYGEDENKKPIQLIQHYTQVNICLSSIAKLQKEPRRIGFDLIQRLDKKDNC
jgi:hypothetical protein